jgi:hypothetical protein
MLDINMVGDRAAILTNHDAQRDRPSKTLAHVLRLRMELLSADYNSL